MIRISFEEPSCELWAQWRAANEAVSDQAIEELAKGTGTGTRAQNKIGVLVANIWAWKTPSGDPAIAPELSAALKEVIEWEVWKLEGRWAADAAIKAVANGEKPKIDEELYKRMKRLFMAASNGKCAYCETKIDKVDQPGDVEHFRPKSRVVDENGKPVLIRSKNGEMVPHPGYYWLAYNWKNFLIACKTCNSPTRDDSGVIRGKWDRFPVSPRNVGEACYWATRPGDEDNELPLFLNPTLQNPDEHFVFDEKTGMLGCKTPEATICEKWLFLNRDGLIEQRKDTYDNVVGRTDRVFSAAMSGARDELKSALEYLSAYRRGLKPYALAGRKALLDSKGMLKDILTFFQTSEQR